MFILRETLEAVFNAIVEDEKIMKIMNLPTVYKNDEEDIKEKKIKQVIEKAITFSSENPFVLANKNNEFPKVKIGNETYSEYGKIRMTICNLQGDNLGSSIFGRPKFEINIYHLGTDSKKALEIIGRLTTKFSGRKLDVHWEDDNGYKHISPTELNCIGAITQVPNINFYEKSGVRFNYYTSYYSSY